MSFLRTLFLSTLLISSNISLFATPQDQEPLHTKSHPHPHQQPSHSSKIALEAPPQPIPFELEDTGTLPSDSTTSPETTTRNDKPENFYEQFVHMLTTLVIIILLILIVSWMLKRLLNSRIKQINNTSSIKILERRSLTPKSTIYLLDILGKGIVISETGSEITFITEFPEGTDLYPTSETTETPPEEGPPSPFQKILQKKFKQE